MAWETWLAAIFCEPVKYPNCLNLPCISVQSPQSGQISCSCGKRDCIKQNSSTRPHHLSLFSLLLLLGALWVQTLTWSNHVRQLVVLPLLTHMKVAGLLHDLWQSNLNTYFLALWQDSAAGSQLLSSDWLVTVAPAMIAICPSPSKSLLK